MSLGDNVLGDAPEILEQIAETLDEKAKGDTGVIQMAVYARQLAAELLEVHKTVYRDALALALAAVQVDVEPITSEQLAEIRALWAPAGFPAIEGRGLFIAGVVDREVSRTGELSSDEGVLVIEALTKITEAAF